MPEKPEDPQERLRAILNGVADSIEEAPDHELTEEVRQDTSSPSVHAERVRALLKKAVSTHQERSFSAEQNRDQVYGRKIEAHLSKSTVSNGEYVEEKIDAALVYKRISQTRAPRRNNSVFQFLEKLKLLLFSKLVPTIALIVVFIFAGTLIYILRNRSEDNSQLAQHDLPKSPKQIEPQINLKPNPPQQPNPPKIKPERQRGGSATAITSPLREVKTIFIDPQESEFNQNLRNALIEQLQASSILSFTEDRENSTARLKITESHSERFTFELISGRAVIWTQTELIKERTTEASSRTAKQIVKRLLDDMAKSQRK